MTVSRAEHGKPDLCDQATSIRPAIHTYLYVKPAVDFLAALLLLIVLSPVMFVAGLVVKLTSRGPAIYRQTRVGLHGRLFRIYKLRTMTADAEAASGPVWCTGNDPRVTRVGRFLRRTHIDEFPQLFNVLRGEMSLIGPRPERPEFVTQLERRLPHYRDRLNVKPGITGLAQVSLPPDTDVASVRDKLLHDLFYVHSLGLGLDLRLLAATAWGFLRDLVTEAKKSERGMLHSPGFTEYVRGIVGSDSALFADHGEHTVLA